jgi:hypothetical protein
MTMPENQFKVYTISGINRLPEPQKQEIYTRLIPPALLERFNLKPPFVADNGTPLLELTCSQGSSDTELKLHHQSGFPDPVLYGHITDTFNGQVHVLLYILNDPASPRFDVDRMLDGTPTKFGIYCRNLAAEESAMQYGLGPGQVRKGLRMLNQAITAFETFVDSLGNEFYFADPLYYHAAILFERYGFTYQRGRKLMERIQRGFDSGGDLLEKLDGSSPFRNPNAAGSIRLRSWAIHDGLLGEPFTNVTMYKRTGRSFGVDTSSGCPW